ncbi:uncharacterized protein LOC131624329 [Vicia villosa]|uniref:uncharacterized protein LOC131624329 n=1 Tax=Vicia villosa TaxID=3911 RepID=UPI00273BD0F5|nr:uncharacterized protein LOC131624329 [Vicia villosa]
MKLTSPESPIRQQPTGRIFVSLSEILALLTKQASRLKGKAKATMIKDGEWRIDLKAPKSVLLKLGKKKTTKKKKPEEEEWRNGPIWQKEILMGGKCEPLDFSGVIYYDINGKQTTEFSLRSPRASPSPDYVTRR